MNKYLKFALKLIATILLILFFLNKIKLDGLFSTFQDFKTYYIILIITNMIVGILITYSALVILLRTNQIFRFFKYFRSYLLSLSIGIVSPARLGDLSFAFLIKDEMKSSKGLAIVIFSKILTIMLMFSIAMIGFAFLIPKEYLPILLGIILALLVLGLILLKFSRRLILRFLPIQRVDFLRDFISTLKDIIKNHKAKIIIFLLIMLAKYSLDSFIAYFLISKLGVHTNYLFIYFINAISVSIALIPITLNGIGLREVVLAYIFEKANLNPAIGASVFFAIVITYSLLTALFPLFYSQKTIETRKGTAN